MKKIAKINEAVAHQLVLNNKEAYTDELDNFATYEGTAEAELTSSQYVLTEIEDNSASLFVAIEYNSALGTWPVRKDKKMFPL